MAKMRTTEGGTIEVKVELLRGKFVQTRRQMRNGWCHIPEGTVCRVDGTWRSGVSLQSPLCRRCGVATSISKVHRDDVLVCTKDGHFASDPETVQAMPSSVEPDITQIEYAAIARARDCAHNDDSTTPADVLVLLEVISRLRQRGAR